MKFDCASLRGVIGHVPLVRGCDTVRSGALRLMTPFQYPNGAHIDLFLEQEHPLFDRYILSDMGQTTSYLLDLQVKPWATNKRRQIIEDICHTHEITWRGGRFLIDLEESDLTDLSGPMMRLGQACIRISDLAFSARLWSCGVFKDEVEEFFQSADLSYETDVTEPGKAGGEIKFDFRITSATMTSLVLTLSAGTKTSAHNLANEVQVRWVDLGRRRQNLQRVTVLDEAHGDALKDLDLKRIQMLSTVFAFPSEREQLREAVEA
jgi:hypothetical protein